MRLAVTAQQMRDMESACFAAGTASLELMERAAQALVHELEDMLGALKDKHIVCYCGQGNNGADGLAVARLLQQAGARPSLRLLGEPKTEQASTQLAWTSALDVPVLDVAPKDAVAALDALFGIGLSRPPQGRAAELIEEINALGVPVLAADIPSGMDADTGWCCSPCVKADRTVSFQALKVGHLLAHETGRSGQLTAADIGIPFGDIRPAQAAETADLRSLLPIRRRDAHKGNHGRVLMYCGSVGSAGAAAMAALGCLRAGAGLITLACEPEIIPILQVLVPNAQCMPIDQVLTHRPRHDVLLAGCGLGQDEQTWQRVMRLWQAETPAVLDADALNVLAHHPLSLDARTLLTPHVGEASRLLKRGAEKVLSNMPGSAAALAQQYGCTVLLKSHVSAIHDGERMAINTVGSPVLAKGGSGDALAGIAAGLMAQGLDAFAAAQAASLWLGSAARLAEECYGPYVPLTGDILMLMGEVSK